MVIHNGTNIKAKRRQNKVLKSKLRLNKAIWMLEKAARGIETQATTNTWPSPGLPTKVASGSQKTAISPHKTKLITRLDQKATLVDLSLSSSFLNSAEK